MKIFVAASYSLKANFDTGEVFPEFKAWLEELLGQLEAAGHEVYCSLRKDGYRVNDRDPVGAFKIDMDELGASDAILAIIDEKVSAGVQLEIGWAYAKGIKVLLAHSAEDKLPYVNSAMVKAGVVHELMLPLDVAALKTLLNS